MTWLKSIFMALVAASLAFGSETRAQTAVTLVGDNNYPPYSYEEKGRAHGIYVEILQEAFEELDGFDLQIQMLPWKRGLALVEDGAAVGIFPPYQHTEARPYIWPYSEPILFEQVAVFCDADALHLERPNWPEDYFGFRIANNRGFLTPGKAFFDAAKDGTIELNEVANARTGLKMLIQGRVDCYVNDGRAIRWELTRLKKEGVYNPGILEIKQGALASGEWGYVGFTDRDEGLFPFKDTLAFRLDKVIERMKTKGRIAEIVNRFFEEIE